MCRENDFLWGEITCDFLEMSETADLIQQDDFGCFGSNVLNATLTSQLNVLFVLLENEIKLN